MASGLEHLIGPTDDVWYTPYDHRGNQEQFMRDYLPWEVALVEQIERPFSSVPDGEILPEREDHHPGFIFLRCQRAYFPVTGFNCESAKFRKIGVEVIEGVYVGTTGQAAHAVLENG